MDNKARLRQFMLDNFDYAGLKEIGFYGKDIRKNDVEAQAARVCEYFGYNSVYEYNPPEVFVSEDGRSAVTVEVGSINAKGEYEPGGGGHLSLVQSEFDCPICTCTQKVKNPSKDWQRCKGCKRPLIVITLPDGKLYVYEK